MQCFRFRNSFNFSDSHRILFRLGQNLIILWLLFIMVALSACTTLPTPKTKTLTYAHEPNADRRLAVITRELLKDMDREESGFYMLDRNDDALRWRLLLADLAEETLDMQYFVWKDDASGIVLLDRVIKAANRGVRVRILVDDFQIIGGDRSFVALNQHPKIDVRLFNPMKGRGSSKVLRNLEFMTHIKQLNHRMHNKLMVVDNRFSIVGGRNIGNEYFGLDPKQNFIDFDLVAVGPITKEVSSAFDLYWNSQWVYPGEALAENFKDQDLFPELMEMIQQRLAESENLLIEFKQQNQDWNNLLQELARNIFSGTAKVVYDEPLVGEDTPPVQLIDSLDELTIDAQQEILVSSPYFIPTDEFYKVVPVLIERGVRGVILTNSLGSTNHPIVHSAYKKHRKKVIEIGVELFEIRHDADARENYDTPPIESGAFGLHAKLIIVDRKFVFVGTLNLDPRSIYINTEFGLIVYSEDLSKAIADIFEGALDPANSWQVLLDDEERLIWKSGDRVIKKDPARSFWQRFQSGFFGIFSLDDQL